MLDPARENSKSFRHEVYISLFDGTLSPLGKVMLRLNDETSSPSGEALDLSGGTSIKPSNKSLS